jgi:hypothetical protein
MSLEPAYDAVSRNVDVLQPTEPIGLAVDQASLQQLVRSAVWRGGCLDDPWRHAYLRARWTGRASN